MEQAACEELVLQDLLPQERDRPAGRLPQSIRHQMPAIVGSLFARVAPTDSGRAVWSPDAALEQGVCMHAYAQGKGEGQVQLKLTYFPFELLYSRPRDASLVRPPPQPCKKAHSSSPAPACMPASDNASSARACFACICVEHLACASGWRAWCQACSLPPEAPHRKA